MNLCRSEFRETLSETVEEKSFQIQVCKFVGPRTSQWSYECKGVRKGMCLTIRPYMLSLWCFRLDLTDERATGRGLIRQCTLHGWMPFSHAWRHDRFRLHRRGSVEQLSTAVIESSSNSAQKTASKFCQILSACNASAWKAADHDGTVNSAWIPATANIRTLTVSAGMKWCLRLCENPTWCGSHVVLCFPK